MNNDSGVPVKKPVSALQQSVDIKVVNAFINEWVLCSNARSALHIQSSTFNLFCNPLNIEVQTFKDIQLIPENTRYDLIIGDIPLGLNQITWNNGLKSIKVQRNWLEILNSLFSLEENGTALFLLEPSGFSSSQGIKFEKILNESGFFVNAYINCPERILSPLAMVTPVLVVLSRKHTERLFIAELLGESQAQEVVNNYFSSIDNTNLVSGKYIDLGDYYGFHRIKAQEQIERLESQYKTYNKYRLTELINKKDKKLQINSVPQGGQFQECDNAIYIPTIGNSSIIYKLADAKLKHQNYLQVVLGDLALNEYVAAFFNSTLGKLVIESLTSGSYIRHITKTNIEQALVALPSLNEQQRIVQTHHKLNDLKVAIDKFDTEIAINPTSSNVILQQLDMMLEAIDSLTDADKVRGIVREGETKYIEFKETLSFCIKTQTKPKPNYVEISALKTVVAFLNTDGGKLLLGVSDDGEIRGLNTEFNKLHKNKLDDFLKHWKNIFQRSIGEEFYPFIEPKLIKVDEKYVLLVECKPSPNPCYLDGKDFYVRTNPATDRLEGPKLVEYVKNHFK